MLAEREADEAAARAFLEDLVSLARIHRSRIVVESGDFKTWASEAPQADVSIFGLAGDPNLAFTQDLVRRSGASCLFVRDSGQESALA